MNDLRELVAAALRGADEDDWQDFTDPYFDLADAVIATLGLKMECAVWQDKPQRRYVTEWIEGGWDHRNL